MTQTGQREPPKSAGGVGAPADDGEHIGSYTVPSDVMNQSSDDARDRLDRESRAESAQKARFPLFGIIAVLLVLLVIAWVTLHAGL